MKGGASAPPAGGKSPATAANVNPPKPLSRRAALAAAVEAKKREAEGGPPVFSAPDKDGYVMYKGQRVRAISTKNVVKKKPGKDSRATAAAATQASEDSKPIKTKLTKPELDHYRALLLALRSQKLGDLNAKESEALQSSGGNLSTMPIHMADIGTDAYDQDFMLALAETDRKLIRDIDEALQRIESKTYGVCVLTRKPIPKARLNAKPWAKYTIEAVRMIENGQVV